MELKINLTTSQQDLIIKEWNSRKDNPPSIKELINLVFSLDLDERSPEGLAIRGFLAKKIEGYKIKIELSESDKEYIKNNCDKLTATEMSRLIFENPKLQVGHPETRAVIAFKKTLVDTLQYSHEQELEEFKAPRTDNQVIKLVNEIEWNAFNSDNITGAERKSLEACIRYFNNQRFLTEIETYQDPNERKMFTNNFIRHVYNKPDLTQQDLDIMILYANEVVEHKRIQDQLSILREQQEVIKQQSDPRMSMSLVEMVNNCTNNLAKSKKVQSELLREINEKRSDRLKKEAANHNSLLNLFSEWREADGRQKLLKIADARKKVLGDKFDELAEMDDYLARIIGNTKEDILYGNG